ncbi:MAG: hypothetical protein AM325_000740 [Candidatus Thorarchaeota archaeon SMTZ1-45]|nr:MAG: hypothetical protein AM325_02125 [Candidatus Thorarchaeota archaeon SMTZ1-45]
MSRFFRRKKKDDKEVEQKPDDIVAVEVEGQPETELEVEAVGEEPAEAEVSKPMPEGREDTIPYHDSIQDRLVYMLKDPVMADGLEGTHEFMLEFMAMGERFWIAKAPLGEIETKIGKAADEDAHIRISNDAVSELLNASTFSQFSKIYLKYYKTSDAGKFIKIEARKPIIDLNRRGYARVPVLKLLIGAAR